MWYVRTNKFAFICKISPGLWWWWWENPWDRKPTTALGQHLVVCGARVIWTIVQMRLCFSLIFLISDMDNSGDNGQNHGASMFDRVRDSERQRRINEALCWREPYANFGCKVNDKETILAGYILEPPTKFRLVLCARKVSDFGVCQQPIMRVICGSESGERSDDRFLLRDADRHLVLVSLGLHASLTRPGLADLTVRGKISLARGIHRCPEFVYFFGPTSICIFWRTCVYIHISDCAETVYELPLLPNNTANTNREPWEVSTWYLSLGRRSGGDWANTWHWTERFTVFFSNRSSRSPQLLPHLLPYRIHRRGLY